VIGLMNAWLCSIFAMVCSSLAAADETDWTRLGYFVVRDSTGTFLSRHVSEENALVAVHFHAFHAGNAGLTALTIESPSFVSLVFVPPQHSVAPPEPPVPPYDSGELLDPNTVYACDGGEAGVTLEPTGSDINSGWLTDGEVRAVKSLARLSQVWKIAPAGTDARLCEGGVFEDQALVLTNKGDIGNHNEAVLNAYHRDAIKQALEERKNSGLYAYMLENVFPEEKEGYVKDTFLGMERYGDNNYWSKVYHRLDGWNQADVNWATLGCYKILNGVPRPCMDPYPICREGTTTKCLDPSDFTVQPYYSP